MFENGMMNESSMSQAWVINDESVNCRCQVSGLMNFILSSNWRKMERVVFLDVRECNMWIRRNEIKTQGMRQSSSNLRRETVWWRCRGKHWSSSSTMPWVDLPWTSLEKNVEHIRLASSTKEVIMYDQISPSAPQNSSQLWPLLDTI